MRKPFTRWLSALLAVVLCLSLVPASALAATTSNGSTVTELGTGSYSVALKNDCDAAVKYSVTLGNSAAQEVTLGANETLTLKGNEGTAYYVEWVGGTDSHYVYTEPSVKTAEGTFGSVTTTHYYYKNPQNGGECTNQVANTITYLGTTIETYQNVYYDVSSLIIFERSKDGAKFVYTNVNNRSESYKPGLFGFSDSDAYKLVYAEYPTYENTRVMDGDPVPDWNYMFMYKTVEPRTETVTGNTEVTFSATAIASGTTGTFKVAALNVDGMPNNVDVAGIKQLELNTDGPESEGSKRIGAYIEESGIDVLALSESFNFYEEINNNAPSYTTGTQRLIGGIPTEFNLIEVATVEFPFDTDGLNLMYKKSLDVSSESVTAWNVHYSPNDPDIPIIDVPSLNGADGMIDKGFRFYQVQVAQGVVVDVYILHMDADDSADDRAARASQIDQLMAAVEANDNGNPILIMGDTNCRYTRDPLESKIINAGFSDPWVELKRGGDCPDYNTDSIMVTPGDNDSYQTGEIVDKVFYKNAEGSNLTIEAVSYDVDADGYTDAGGLLGDHPPVIVEFEYTLKSNAEEHVCTPEENWTSDGSGHWHECTDPDCTITMNSQKNGYAVHSYGDYTVFEAATCTTPGTETRTCSECGYADSRTIPMTGHSWNEGVVTKPATSTTEGVKTYTCTVCDATRTETIPVHEHSWDTSTWTNDDNGHWHACTAADCDITDNTNVSQNTTYATHTWDEGEVTTEPTYTQKGEMKLTCSVCGYEKTEEIPVLTPEYVFTLTFDKESYNVGETATATISLSKKAETNVSGIVGAIGFALDVPDGLTLGTVTSSITGGSVSIKDGIYGISVDSGTGITVNETGVEIAEVTFTVNNEFEDETADVTLGLSHHEVTELNGFYPSGSEVVTDSATLVKSYTVTLEAGDHVSFDGAPTSITVTAGTTFGQLELPDVTADQYYTFDGWYNDETKMTDDTPVTGGMTLTAKAVANTYTFAETSDNADVTVTSGVSDGKATYGQNITFTVTPDGGYAVTGVTYTVGNAEPVTMTAEGDTYTIPGSAITGDVAVTVSTVQYHTVTFKAGTGVNMTETTVYVKDGVAGFYTDTTFAQSVDIPTATAEEGYRLADEPLWSGSNGQSYTTDALDDATFTENVTLTAQAVKTWTVTFQAGSNVSLTGNTTVTVDEGTAFSAVSKPSYTVAEHYTFAGWYNNGTVMNDDDIINSDLNLTANAVASSFNFSEVSDNADVDVTSGVTNGKATYGTPITFTVAPNSSYVISGVSYTVGNNSAAIPLTAVNGTYTIPGSAITDNIKVEVTATQYHTVTFVAGTGVDMTSATAYVKDGQAALYTDTSFTTTFTVPTPVAQTGYRLAADTAAEPLWSDGTNKYQTSALGSSVTFNADATLTAQAVKQWTVTFAAGDHGTLSGTTTLTVDTGTVLTQEQIPSVTAEAGYTFTGWNSDVSAAITADTTFTAQYNNATYTLTLPTVTGVTFTVTGAKANDNGTYTVTHGTNVTIGVTVDETKADVESVSYSIGNGTQTTVELTNNSFTISGASITGNITLTVDSTAVYAITVEVVGENGTVNGGTTSTKYFNKGTSAETVAAAFEIVANTGYEYETPAFTAVTDDATYTVTFTAIEYEITVIWDDDQGNGFDYKHPNEDAGCDEDVVFTPNLSLQDSTEMVFEVWYYVGEIDADDNQPVQDDDWDDFEDGELAELGWTELQPNDEGKFVISRSAITGPVTIYYDTIDGSFELIAEEDYKAAPDSKQVAVLNTAKRGSGTYTLEGYGDMFWSSKYNAYVCFVDDEETVETLTWKLDENGNTVTEIDYDGDLNDTGFVTPADTAAINAVLHNITVSYEISDLLRFRFDVTGDGAVTAQDIMWILNKYTGFTGSNA